MRSPALALTGQVWWRHRRGLAVCATVWLVSAVVARLVPGWAWARGPEDDPLLRVYFAFVIGSLVPVLVYVVHSFSYTLEAQLEARETAFPKRTFTLPVTTPTLVVWPMLLAVTALAGCWVAWVVAVLRPAGIAAPLGWPAVAGAALMAWLQAVSWMPFPLRLLRIAATVVVMTIIVMTPTFGLLLEESFAVPRGAWMAVLAASIPAAYAVAVVGVARARRGDTSEWTWPGRLVKAVVARLPRRRAAFSSALQAQTWFEWRLRGFGFPLTIALLLLVWAPIALTGAEQVIVGPEDKPPAIAAAIGVFTPQGLWLAILLALPPLFAGLSGIELGGTRYIGQRPLAPACHPFLALRPLTDGELVLAKLRMAAHATLVAWVLVFFAAPLWLAVTGTWRGLAGAPFLQPYTAAEVGIGLAACLAALILCTWIGLVANLGVGLTGRAWVQTGVGYLVSFVWVPLGLLGYWLYQHPEYLEVLQAALPYLLAGYVVLKLLLAGWLARVLWRRGLVSPRGLALSAAVWAAIAAGAVVLLGRMVTPEWMSLPDLAMGVVLLLPLNRFAVAPLALAWNRHR